MSRQQYTIPLACTVAVLLHFFLLKINGLNWKSTPISELSQTDHGSIHTLALWIMAYAQFRLSTLIRPLKFPSPTQLAKLLCKFACVLLIQMSVTFHASEQSYHTIFLWVLASLIGTIMTLLIPATYRCSKIALVINCFCLTLWITLIPLGLMVEAKYEGLYQSSVAVVYVIWLAGVSTFMHDNVNKIST